MSQKYLTIVYAIDEKTDVGSIYRAHPWVVSSHSHAIDDVRALQKEVAAVRAACDAARLEIASLHAQLEAVGAGGVGRLVGDTPRPNKETAQFLSDVMTAAGLVEHGKQCKALAERLSDGCRTLLTALAVAPMQPQDGVAFELWRADHMPNKSREDAWAEWCALHSNQSSAPAQPHTQKAAQNPLTTEEIDALCTQVGFTSWSEWDGGDYQSMWYELAQAIEAAHGITEPEAAGTTKEVVLMEFRFGPKTPEPDQPEPMPLTQEEIVSMAIEADPWGTDGHLTAFALSRPSTLFRFAALVTAAERHACAAACEKVKQRAESVAKSSLGTDDGVALNLAMAAAAHKCMRAIAARGSNGHQPHPHPPAPPAAP